MMALFWKVYPATNPAIPLYYLGDWLYDCACNPFLSDSHAVRTLPRVPEILCVFEDGQSREVDTSSVLVVNTLEVVDPLASAIINSLRRESLQCLAARLNPGDCRWFAH